MSTSPTAANRPHPPCADEPKPWERIVIGTLTCLFLSMGIFTWAILEYRLGIK